MPASPRILTFNFHEPYLCLMAKTGYPITVGLYAEPPNARPWQTQFRSIPSNLTLVEESAWRRDLEAGRFDVVIAQNESNALDVLQYDVPKILVCHNRRTFLRTAATLNDVNVPELYEKLLGRLREAFAFVFISESKRADYGIPGRVILPGIDVEEYGGYSGERLQVLRVGNMMRARNLMFDVDFQERVCEGLPTRVTGLDPSIPGAAPAASFEDLLQAYRSSRCLLHVTREAYEDGYNLAMLEAMACGTPVVSLANATSPLTHGVDGYLSSDPEELRGHIRALFDDLDLARAVGAKGRETVTRRFPITAFVERWRAAIEETAESKGAPPHHSRAETTQRNLLIQYVASPITTGRYFEAAARTDHRVATAGFRCPERMLLDWGFEEPIPPYAPHDVDIVPGARMAEILSRLPQGFRPDLYLWIDSGLEVPPDDLESANVPKACYLIDTHVRCEERLAVAKRFDYTFLAQKGQVAQFEQAGIPNVAWLPLACDPALHDIAPRPRCFDVAYVGGLIGDATDRRRALLQSVAARFPNHRIGRCWPAEMARVYAQSKIVVNASVNRDLNMRVFEAMASGALLITDEAEGLEDLFEDGTHLVVYRRDEDLLDVIERYLRDDAARERIAAAGSELVRREHTYAQRIERIVRAVPARAPAHEAQPFDEEGYYRNVRPELAQFVPLGVERLLDVGCGCGEFGRSLKAQGVREVHGIEIVEHAYEEARRVLDSALLGNIETMDLPFAEGYFDCITFADVLEHLVHPVEALRKAARVLAPDGIILMSIPNVRFYQVLAMLANGRWQYVDAGIMDRTHLRFFTAPEMRAMVEEAGLECLAVQTLSYMPEERVPRDRDGAIQLGQAKIWPRDEDDFRDLCTFQYVVIAGTIGGDRLAKARLALERRDHEAAIALATQARNVDEAQRRSIAAIASARLGQLSQAEALLREGLALSPEHPGMTAELGILLLAMNRIPEAASYLERAATLNPEHDRAIGALGLVRMTQSRDAEAMACFLQALDAGFDNVALVPHLVQTAQRLGRPGEILATIRRYAEFYPGNSELNCTYASVLAAVGRTSEARDHLETLLLLDPGNASARELLGTLRTEGDAAHER